MKKTDEYFMGRALGLARRGTRLVRPNPRVGAVLTKQGKILAQGYHSCFGGLHAEAKVIRKAGRRVRGATLYVTLEPCSTEGKTPACTRSIIAAGIKKVVIGAIDPNPQHQGIAPKILEKAGIEVILGIKEAECRALNRDFEIWITRHRPYTLLKLAESLDGKIATRTGDSKWITSSESRKEAHRLRAHSDAVIVGIKTVLADDPGLDARMGFRHPGLIKVVVDSSARTPPSARLFRQAKSVLIAVGDKAPAARISCLEDSGAEIIRCPQKKEGQVDLTSFWKVLADRQIMRVMVEGGGSLAAGCLERGLVDEVCFFIAPIIIGGSKASPSVGGKGAAMIPDALELRDVSVKRFSRDLQVRGYISKTTFRTQKK